jgi:hypothetical protein
MISYIQRQQPIVNAQHNSNLNGSSRQNQYQFTNYTPRRLSGHTATFRQTHPQPAPIHPAHSTNQHRANIAITESVDSLNRRRAEFECVRAERLLSHELKLHRLEIEAAELRVQRERLALQREMQAQRGE